jgi:hypothetical protein
VLLLSCGEWVDTGVSKVVLWICTKDSRPKELAESCDSTVYKTDEDSEKRTGTHLITVGK